MDSVKTIDPRDSAFLSFPSLFNICLRLFNMLLHIRRVDQPQ